MCNPEINLRKLEKIHVYKKKKESIWPRYRFFSLRRSCRSSIVRVWKQRGLSNRNHPFDTVRITHSPTLLTLRTPNTIAEWISYCSLVFVCMLLCGRSWTTQSPNNTSKRERSILERRSQSKIKHASFNAKIPLVFRSV